MFQRLSLARDLLAEDGAIFISIDDHELFNLGLLMNQVFGEKCFVANCVWQKRYSRENRESIGDAHEYLLVYSPNPDRFKLRRGLIRLTEEQARVYRNPDNPTETDPTKRWRGIPMTAQGFRPNQMYRITAPNGKPHDPPEGRCWSMIEPEFLKLKEEGRIYWGRDGNAQPSVIRFLSEVDGVVPWTWWPHDEAGHTDEARKDIQELFGTQTAFDTPKPLRLMERVLQIGAPGSDDLAVDFFAGSGTLGHAVLKMNKADGGSRHFILVSSREATQENPDKNLCREICAGRIRMAIEGYGGRNGARVDGLGGTFAYLEAVTVPMHRLEDHLTDEMVWTHALMLAGHLVTPLQRPLSVSTRDEQLVAYCADTKPATLGQLKDAIAQHKGLAQVFSWTPGAVAAALEEAEGRVSIVAVPDDLRRTFRQGNARSVENEAGDMA